MSGYITQQTRASGSAAFGAALLGLLTLIAPASASAQTLVAPSSATASNQIASPYDVSQTINGGGLTGTGLSATHALVTNSGYENRFWISTGGAGLPITLTYNYASAPTLSGVAIWNAVFTLPLQGHYQFDGAPTLFDLQITHAGGTRTYTNIALGTTQTAAQRFDFCENLSGVTQIQFIIRADSRPAAGSDRNTYLSEFRGIQEATPTCANALDLVAPTLALTAPVNSSRTNDNTPTLSGTAADDRQLAATAPVTVTVTNAANVVVFTGTPTVGAGGVWTVDASTLPDGNYTVRATARDASGNTATAGPNTFTIDTTLPALAIVAPVSGVVTSDTTPTLAGTASDNLGLAAMSPVTVTVTNAANVVVFTGTPTVGAGGVWTIDASVLPQGTYTVRATARDAVGNTATAGPNTLTIDITPPVVALTAPTNNSRTNDTTPQLAGTSEVGAVVTVTVTTASNVVVFTGTPLVNVGGVWTVDATLLPEGTYTVRATARDAAGNTATAGPNTFTVDTTPPAVAITAPADDSITNDNTLALAGTAEAGATVQITVDGAVVGTTTANAGGAWTFTTTTLADGPRAISVIATDAAGNASPPAVIDVIVDAAAPALVLATPAAGLQTNDVTLALTGTATDSGAGLATLLVEVLDAQAQVVFTATVIPAADGSFAVDASALPEGVYTARATATDVAGNSVTITNTPITVDTTAPAIALLTPADDAALDDDTPTVSGTAEVGAALEVVIRDAAGMIVFTAAPVVAADGTWSVDTSALADGAYTAQVTATDAAGNAASTPNSAFLIDTTAPVVVIVSPADDAIIASAQPTIQGTSEANSTLTLELRDAAGAVVATLTATADAQGAWSAPVTASLVDGAYTISATAVDVVGNASAPVESSFTINSTALPLNITAPMPGAVVSAAPQIVGTTAPGAVVSVEIVGAGGAVVETLTVTADNTGAWSATPMAALVDGAYTVEATVRNPAGVESDATTSFTVDTTAPALAIATPAEGAQTNNPQPSISGTAEAGATLEIVITNAAGAVVETLTATADAQGMWSVTPATLADGAYTINVEASDAAGNTATAGPRAFTVDSGAPTVTITSPAAGQEVVDTTPTVTGTAEPGAVVTIVIDGQVAGMATAGADGMWSFEVAELTPGTHTVEARTTDGAGNMGSSGSVSFEVKTQAPVVIVTPAMGGTVTGPTVVVTGTGEPGATITVTVGGQTKTVVVGQDGSWSVSFDAVPAGSTTIEAGDGSTSTSVTVTVNDPTVVPGDEDALVLAGGCAQGAGGGPASGALWMLVLGALTLRRRGRRIVGGHQA